MVVVGGGGGGGSGGPCEENVTDVQARARTGQ